jgi:hypothetical protein
MRYYMHNGIPVSFKEVGPLVDDEMGFDMRAQLVPRSEAVERTAAAARITHIFNKMCTILEEDE